MFIQNQITSLPNHLKKIKELLNNSDKLYLTVAYIRNSGVDMLIEDLKSIVDKKGEIRLICSNDMGITQPSAIKRLIDMGAKVKVCKFETGTFHPKIWLSERDGAWACMVGSANCSKAAFSQNVEASIVINKSSNINGAIEQSLMFFEYLWNNDKCFDVTEVVLSEWQERKKIKQEVKNEIEVVKVSGENEKIIKVLFDYVKFWTGIPKEQKQEESDFVNSLWRGWYVIPDQGLIDNETISMLQKITSLIKTKLGTKGYIDISKGSEELNEILKTLESKFKREEHIMEPRDLFVRQEKNYLIRLGFALQVIKENGKEDDTKLTLTESGHKFADCVDKDSQKSIYTNNLLYKTWGNVNILNFTVQLLLELGSLSLNEFYLFVMHADSASDLKDIKDLVLMFRKLSVPEQELFMKNFNTYFDEVKGMTAKNVRGNFVKHAKHTMSALGWAQGLSYEADKSELRIIDKNKLLRDLDISEQEL